MKLFSIGAKFGFNLKLSGYENGSSTFCHSVQNNCQSVSQKACDKF